MLVRVLKIMAHGIALVAASPFLVYSLAGLRVFGTRGPYSFSAWTLAFVPGLPGLLMRRAFYRATLDEAHWDLSVQAGSVFVRPDCRIGPNNWFGAYCVIGRCRTGRDVLVASRVSILSGRRQHALPGASEAGAGGVEFRETFLGDAAWIGEGAVVMADVGDHAVVGAGSVVVHPVEPWEVVGGNPARRIRLRAAGQGSESPRTDSPGSGAASSR